MSSSVSTEIVMLLAALLLWLGITGVIIRKNIIFMLLSVEIMLNASGLAFVAAGSRWGNPTDRSCLFLFWPMAAAEVSIGLALILQIYHQHKSLDIDKLREMNG